MKPPGKYRIGAFRPFMPDWARFVILLVTVLVFQLSGAVYLGNLNEMVGSTALTAEDVRLLGTTSFIGMTVVFPILFRIKLRFMSRTILLGCGLVVIAGNAITMSSTSMPVLLATAFTVGLFKMIGTFECMSSMQLVVTPTRDFSVFFSFLYLIVVGAIQLSGLLSAHLAHAHDWQRMHVAIIGAMAAVLLVLAATLRPFRFAKKMPLYQIDWLSMALWSALLLLLNFVFEYGTPKDWLASDQIRAALFATLVLLVCTGYRMFTTRRPFIPAATFGYKNVLVSLLLFAGFELMMSTTYVVLPAYTEGVLGFDGLHYASLNWAVLAGIGAGAAGCYHWLARCRGGYKTIIFGGFLCMVLAHLLLFKAIGPALPKESLYLPSALRGAGQAVIYVALTVYLTEGVPFRHFFPALALVGVVRTATGGTIADGLATQLIERMFKSHRVTLGQELDGANAAAAALQQNVAGSALARGHSVEQAGDAATGLLYGKLQLQAMLVSWREMMGWWALVGTVLLLGLLAYHYGKPGAKRLPTLRQMAAYTNPVTHMMRRIRRATAKP